MKNLNESDQDVQLLNPEEFLKRYEEDPESISSSHIIPPELGKPGYGKILVNFNTNTFSPERTFLINSLLNLLNKQH